MKKEKCKKTTGWNNENNAKKSLIEIQKQQKTEISKKTNRFI